jgi:hypothetical protein
MPSVIDAPELVDYVETHDRTIETLERRKVRHTRPGFWRTLAHRMTTYLTLPQRERYTPSFETAMDRVVQEYPSLSTYAFARL